MIPDFIQARRETLTTLCRTHRVRWMSLFGSATGERFNAGLSDVDFLVQFEAMPPAQHAANFFDLLDALRNLFQRPVDLVEESALRNPYLRSRIQAQQVRLYGA